MNLYVRYCEQTFAMSLSYRFQQFLSAVQKLWYLQSLNASVGSLCGKTWEMMCCRDSKVLSILSCFFPDCPHKVPTCQNSSSPVLNLCSSLMNWITNESLSTSANQTSARFKRPFRGSPSLAHLSLLLAELISERRLTTAFLCETYPLLASWRS